MNYYIEEMSMNAQPALQTLLYDGWVLRFTRGYTKRANSVHPIYTSNLALEEKISACEHFYHTKGIPTVFKMTSQAKPETLDAVLASKGYREDARTCVEVLDMTSLDFSPSATAAQLEITIEKMLSKTWLDHFCRLTKVSGQNKETLTEMLESIISDCLFASLKTQGRVIGCGLGVLQNGYVGIFDIVVDELHRNRGYGRQLVCALLKEAKEKGIKKSYLQVVADNHPAKKLYANLGYREVYQYWYRIKQYE